MQVGCGWIEAGLDPQRLTRLQGFLQSFAQLRLTDDLRGALLDICELFVNRGKFWHQCDYRERLSNSLRAMEHSRPRLRTTNSSPARSEPARLAARFTEIVNH